MPTTKQIGYIYGLIRRAQVELDKDEVILQYTDGRTSHISELTADEVQTVINALGGGSDNKRIPQERKIISMAHEMGWELPDEKIDMHRVNTWLVKHTPDHLPLNSIPVKRLSMVVTIFEKMYKEFLKGL